MLNDKNYFIACSILCISGFVIGYYKKFAMKMIEKEKTTVINIFGELDSVNAQECLEECQYRWRIDPYFFSHPSSVGYGKIIIIMASLFNIIYNPWYTSIMLLFLSYLGFRYFSFIIKWKIQPLSIFTFIISILWIIISWI